MPPAPAPAGFRRPRKCGAARREGGRARRRQRALRQLQRTLVAGGGSPPKGPMAAKERKEPGALTWTGQRSLRVMSLHLLETFASTWTKNPTAQVGNNVTIYQEGTHSTNGGGISASINGGHIGDYRSWGKLYVKCGPT
ncbi:hypothetical protein VULLAG_LOCUS4113 [Vulpes lagopus]